MVVGPDNKPVQRTVKIGSQNGENWVVTDGLKEGEKVMVDGFQKLQMLPPGTPVQPVAWTPTAMPDAAPAAPANAGAPAARPSAAGVQAAAAAPAAHTAAGTGNTRQ
jgi:membrane fusion protein (multidrug efflux system)